ncbi:hypothetical protein HY642_02645 [Candidatus Woesearchaeota archaeon]|nr:hypothetical protein [Candidatus Woesearchaeota archaeon]
MKPRLLNAGGSVCGAMSVLGSYQLCHSICLGIIAILTMMGIVVTGMPLMFLTKVAVPFWIAAAIMLVAATTLTLVFQMFMSKKMLLANAGLLIAGVPFQAVDGFRSTLWAVGGVILVTAIAWAIADRRRRHE